MLASAPEPLPISHLPLLGACAGLLAAPVAQPPVAAPSTPAAALTLVQLLKKAPKSAQGKPT